jgi:hypothetical protein
MAHLNRLQINGNHNIQLADIHHSSVVINLADQTALAQLVDELRSLHQDGSVLSLLVLATTQARLQPLAAKLGSQEYWAKLLACYGQQPEEWRPFADEPIGELAVAFQASSGFRLEVLFVDGWDLAQDPDLVSDIKSELRRRTILVADGLALHFADNQFLAKLFDEDEIGGCLVPIWQGHPKKLQDLVQAKVSGVFSHLNTLFFKRFNYSCMFVELVVPTREVLFRRLTNIATKHLGLQPERRVRWGNLGPRAQAAGRMLNFPTL